MKNFGIIGAGNMGGAILRGMLRNKVLPPERVMIFDANAALKSQLQAELGIAAAADTAELLAACDMLLLAVKPDVCGSVIENNYAAFDSKAVISIAAGWSGEKLRRALPETARVLRIMPNTPAMAGEGMIVFEAGDSLFDEEREFITAAFSAIGRVSTLAPKLMNAVTGVSGSGPAYVYLFIEALADGGVRAGLPRNIAYELAAQTVLGAAKMVLDTKRHPGALKDAVCSPGGTTIEAVACLEERGLRSAVIEAVAACVDKAASMEADNNI